MADLDVRLVIVLDEHPGSSAKEHVAVIRRSGIEATKSEINSALYRALAGGCVVREEGTPPRWSVSGSERAAALPDLEQVIGRYLAATGESWSPAQRRAALVGPRVSRMAAFSQAELDAALERLGAQALTWDTW